MQVQSDPFLGWTHMGGRDYLVRQLNDHKSSVELEDLAGDGLAAFAQVCGELLARSHARAGDPLVISGYLGNGANFAEALADFGEAYADQTEKDWQDLRRALRHPASRNPSRPVARKSSSRKK
jgi:thiamine monophosphate kinase